MNRSKIRKYVKSNPEKFSLPFLRMQFGENPKPVFLEKFVTCSRYNSTYYAIEKFEKPIIRII